MPEQQRADVLVIGSGPAGAAVTKRLTDHGAKVVCLEQGDWVKPQDYPSTRPDWEIALRRGPFHFNPNVRRRPEDYPHAWRIGRQTVSLPLSPKLSDEDVEDVIRAVEAVLS